LELCCSARTLYCSAFTAAHRLDLSPHVNNKTGIWSADPLTKGSAGVNALVHEEIRAPDLYCVKGKMTCVSNDFDDAMDRISTSKYL
jgi:hypothetical protein